MTPIVKELIDSATDTSSGLEAVNQELFAELIIRECASIADSMQTNPAGCGYITQTTGSRIKQHFGVE